MKPTTKVVWSMGGEQRGPMGIEHRGTDGERRRMPRYHLAVPVDIWLANRRMSKPHRGSLHNLSGVGVGLTLGQPLKTNQKVTLRFPMYSAEGTGASEFLIPRGISEFLTARVIWQRGDCVGLAFDPPLEGTKGGVVFQQITGEGRLEVDPLLRADSSAVRGRQVCWDCWPLCEFHPLHKAP